MNEQVSVHALLVELAEWRMKVQVLPNSEELVKQIDKLAKPLRENHIDGSGLQSAATTCAIIRQRADMTQNDVLAYSELIRPHVEAVKNGDLTSLEEILVGQVISLQVLHSHLTALGIGSEQVAIAEKYFHLALKAQNQSRTTVLALNELRNPRRATFIKNQLNQLHLSQNETDETQAKTLEASPYAQAMDFRTEATPAGTNPTMETVGKVHRPNHRGRKRNLRSKRA